MSLLLLFMPGDDGGGGGDPNCQDSGGRVQCRRYVCERRGQYNARPLYVPRFPICGTETSPTTQPGLRIAAYIDKPLYSRAPHRCSVEGLFVLNNRYEGLRFGKYDDRPIYAVTCKPCESGTCDGVFDTLYEALGDEIPFTVTDADPVWFEPGFVGYSGTLRKREYWADFETFDDPDYPGCLPQDFSHPWYWSAGIPSEYVKDFTAGLPGPEKASVSVYAYVDCFTTEAPLCVNVLFGVIACTPFWSTDTVCDNGVNCTSTCDDEPYQWDIEFSESLTPGTPFLAFTATE